MGEYMTVDAVIVYRHDGEEITFTTQDMEEFLTKVDEIQYVLKDADLISVTNNGNPVPMVRGWR